jgi:hypothetical protein
LDGREQGDWGIYGQFARDKPIFVFLRRVWKLICSGITNSATEIA